MIKAAVIGVGSMGRNHARVFNELPEAHLVAVADIQAEAAQAVASREGVAGYASYIEMLEKERPEIVSIAVPTALHATVSVHALEAGAHILIEKPIAGSLEEGQQIIQRASAMGKKLMVGHIVRFNPAVKVLKEKIAQDESGRIFQIVCRRVGPFPARIRDVGVVIDLATHDLDLMRYLTGGDPIRLYAETEQRIHTDHEDLLLGLLRFAGGITGALEINWLTPTKVREVLVLGERGLFKVDDLTQDLYFFENAQVDAVSWPALQNLKGVSEGSMTRFAIPRYEPLKAELQAFIKAVMDDSPVPVDGRDGLAALRLALAMVESSKTHKTVEVDE
ncbi:MAG: Gfo/Idh/MocA family oxidoreductase [Anaerolineales bacterium]